jgi:hypothetical protein
MRPISEWDDNRRNNNCYAFAFGDLRVNSPSKLQPGQLSGNKPLTDKTYSCPALRQLVLDDHPEASVIPDGQKCAHGHYRVALFLDNDGKNRDYHFYREVAPNTWLHKPGSLPVSNVDDSGNVIHDPRKADRDYVNDGPETSGYNYAEYCGMFCAPAVATTGDGSGRGIAMARWIHILVSIMIIAGILMFIRGM